MTTDTHLAVNEHFTDNLLLKFIHQNNVKKVKQLMTVDTVDVNQLCYCWSHKSNISYTATPLTLAVRFAGRRMVSALLSNKRVDIRRRADPNVDCDLTPLGVAVEKDDPLLIALLLHAGANAEQYTLKLASLEHIGQQSPKSDTCLNPIRSTPMQIATQNNCIHIVMLLQKAGDKSIDRSTGATDRDSVKISDTCENRGDNFRTVQSADYCLEQSGSMPGDKTSNHQTDSASQLRKSSGRKQWQLRRACAFGNVATAKNMLSRGVDASQADDYGYSPIHYACITDGAHQLIELLKTNGADIDARNFEGKTALQIALEIDNLKAVFSLISHSCAIPLFILNCRNSRGNTLLHIACKQNQTLAMPMLLLSGASPDIVNTHNKTPVFYAWNTNADSKQQLRESLFLTGLLNISQELGRRLCRTILCEMQVCSIDCCAYQGRDDQHSLLCSKCRKVNPELAGKLFGRNFFSNGNHKGMRCSCEYSPKSIYSRNCLYSLLSRMHRDTRLYFACKDNETRLAIILINCDEDVNYVDSDGCTPLHFACEYGNEDLVNALILHGARVNYANVKGNTPLHAACQKNRLSVARILLKAGADTKYMNADGYMCLHVACEIGGVDMVRFLVNDGVPVNLANKIGNTPLHLACQRSCKHMVKTLLYDGAEPANIDCMNAAGNTSLHIACNNGLANIVSILIDAGADVTRLDGDGNNCLHVACSKGHKSVADLILRKGADVNCVNAKGSTSLHIACREGLVDIVSILLNNGVDVNRMAADGNTSLHVACHRDCDRLVKAILYDGAEPANIDCMNAAGNTSLHIACNNGHANIVSILIDAGADVTRLDGDGNNCLHVACSKGHKSVADLILRKGADVNCVNAKGSTSLHIACREGLVDIVSILLNNGVDVNRMDADGNTSLHVACATGHQDSVRLLINSGIDVNVLNRNGESPLRCAFDNDHNSLVIWMISSTPARVSEDILCGFSKKRKTLLQMLYESNGDKATMLNFIDNGIRINVSKENSSGGCDDSSKCLFSYVRKYGLSFVKTLVEHGLVFCSRKCLLLMDNVHHETRTTHYVRRVYPLQDICRWWIWLTHSGVHLTQLELVALQDDDTDNALSVTDLQWLQNEIESPRSLARSCIYAIRRHLVMIDPHGRSIHRSIEKLPLPTELKRQLKLQNISEIEFSSDEKELDVSTTSAHY